MTGAVQRVEQACAKGGDRTALRLRIVEEIRNEVGFDRYVFLLTDPESSVGSAPLADMPKAVLQRLPDLIKLKYATEANRWTSLDGVAVGPGLMDGVESVASLVFRDRFGCWGFLDLWRSSGSFDSAEVALLKKLIEPVTVALRRCQLETFAGQTQRLPRPGPVVLLLSRELEIKAQTPETEQYLRELIPPPDGRPPIPAGAYNVAAQLLANEAGVDDHPAWARVHLGQGLWLTMRAAPMGDSIAVSIEESSPAERVDLFGRACGLSVRERELLGYVVKGYDTKEIAELMFLSGHTVQDHLKSIFAKSATHNRKTLLARALGT